MAKLIADDPEVRGVEWLRGTTGYAKVKLPLSRSLAIMKREASEKEVVRIQDVVQGKDKRSEVVLPTKDTEGGRHDNEE